MGSSFRCIDIIYKAVNILGIRIVVLHGNLYQHVVLLALAVDHIVIKRHVAAI